MSLEEKHRIRWEGYFNAPLIITPDFILWGGRDTKVWVVHRDETPELHRQIGNIMTRWNPKSVLEIGFGLGITGDEFLNKGVRDYTVIEGHPQIAQGALRWAQGKPNVTVIQDKVQNVTLTKRFDVIYDDHGTDFYDEPAINWPSFNYRHYIDFNEREL